MTIYSTEEARLKAQCELLAAQLAEALADNAYFEKELLSGDGHRCEECRKVRHIDDCIRVGDWYACSERCAGKLERDMEEETKSQWHEYSRQTAFNKL